MPKTLEQVRKEIEFALEPAAPVRVTALVGEDAILVGDNRLAFAILRKTIDDNLHIASARETYPYLLSLLKEMP